jgi:hypothetical protein
MEMRVSIVAVAWRKLVQAALWKGKAPQITTGAASVSDSHCQLVNCSAGIIAIAITGTVRTSEMSRRSRSEAVGSSPSGADASGFPAFEIGSAAV